MYKNISDILYGITFDNDNDKRRAALRSPLWPAAQAVCLRMSEFYKDSSELLYVLQYKSFTGSTGPMMCREIMVLGKLDGFPLFAVYMDGDEKICLRYVSGDVPTTFMGPSQSSTMLIEASTIRYFINAVNNNKKNVKKDTVTDTLAKVMSKRMERLSAGVIQPLLVQTGDALRDYLMRNSNNIRKLQAVMNNTRITMDVMRAISNGDSLDGTDLRAGLVALSSAVGSLPAELNELYTDLDSLMTGDKWLVGWGANYGFVVGGIDIKPLIGAVQKFCESGYFDTDMRNMLHNYLTANTPVTRYYPSFEHMPNDMAKEIRSSLVLAKINADLPDHAYMGPDGLIYINAITKPATGYVTTNCGDMKFCLLHM